jgi:hypothetical protein
MEEFMATQQTPQPPPEEDTEAPLLPSQQPRAVNTFADLKLAETPLAQTSPDALRGGHYYSAERIPPELVDGAKKALKEMNLPAYKPEEITEMRRLGMFTSVAAITSAEPLPIENPNRQEFAIPGYGGKWALSVDRKFIGDGHVSAEGWANVAKRLGQAAPSVAPVSPH